MQYSSPLLRKTKENSIKNKKSDHFRLGPWFKYSREFAKKIQENDISKDSTVTRTLKKVLLIF